MIVEKFISRCYCQLNRNVFGFAFFENRNFARCIPKVMENLMHVNEILSGFLRRSLLLIISVVIWNTWSAGVANSAMKM